MVGYDKSRFFGLTKSEEEELQCGICLAIFVDPLVTQCCRQTYCGFCIKHWLSEHNTCPNDRQYLTINCLIKPPRLVINMLNKLKINCDYRDNGCDQYVLFGDLRVHLNNCAHNPDAICSQCGVKNGRKEAHKCLQNLAQKNAELESILAEQRRANDRSNQMIGELKDKLNFSEISLRQKNDAIKTCEVRYALLEEECKTKSTEIRRLRHKIIKFKHKIAELQSDVSQTLGDTYETIELQELELPAPPDTDDDATEIEVIEERREEEEDSQFTDTTLRLKLENISQMSAPICGESFRFKSMLWNIMATPRYKRYDLLNQPVKDLGFFLQCNNGADCWSEASSSSWWCEANAELILIAQKAGTRNLVRNITHRFYSEENDWGFNCFTSWDDIMNEVNGFVKDDAIVLEVHLSVISTCTDTNRSHSQLQQHRQSCSNEQQFSQQFAKKARKY